jgi:hypothetical protein
MQPAVSDTDLAVVWKSASDRPWETHYAHTPIFCLYYIDGSTQGQGYTDARVMSGARSIQGAAQVRAAFTVSGAKKTATSVSVRLRKTGSPGNLGITLIDGSGTTLEQGTIGAQAQRDVRDYHYPKTTTID